MNYKYLFKNPNDLTPEAKDLIYFLAEHNDKLSYPNCEGYTEEVRMLNQYVLVLKRLVKDWDDHAKSTK